MQTPRLSTPLAFRRAPLFHAAVALGVGIWLSLAVPSPKISGIGLIAAGLCAMFAGRRTASVAIVLLIVGLGIFLGAMEVDLAPDRVRVLMDSGSLPENHPMHITGRLESDPESAPQGVFLRVIAERIEIRTDELKVSGTVRVFVSGASDISKSRLSEMDLREGDSVRVPIRLERGDRYLNPGVIRNRDVLDGQGLDAAARLKSALLVEVIGKSDHLLTGPRSWRNALVRRMSEIFPQPVSGVMIASLLGNGYYLDKRTGDLFREGGTFHVLVISGLHITFIGGLLLIVVSWITSHRGIQYLSAVGCLWAYSLAVGAEVPVLRAVIMFSIVLAGRAIRREGSTLNSLGCAAFILLVWRPYDLFSPSFQLTFLSVWAIAAIAMPLTEKMKSVGEWTPTRSEPLPPDVWPPLRRFCETVYWREEKWEFERRRSVWSGVIFKRPFLAGGLSDSLRPAVRIIFEGIVYSVAVQAAMLPVQILYFHRLSTGGIILDLWVGFFIAVESFLAVIAVVLSFISSGVAEPFVKLAEASNEVLFLLPELFSASDISSVRVPLATGFPLFAVLMFACVFFASSRLLAWNPFEARYGRRISRGLAGSVGAVFLVSASVLVFNPFGPRFEEGALRLDFLDVGQGDSVFIVFPDGTTMLVDGGGLPKAAFAGKAHDEEGFEPDTREIGESVVSEFLWERGYSTIDYLLATHADTDHMQGLETVVRNFSTGRVLVGRFAEGDDDFDTLADTLARNGKAPELVGVRDTFEIGGVAVTVLHPRWNDSRGEKSANNDSVVLMIRYGARRILLTGDIEKEGEEILVASGISLKADVVKVAHHGSRTSSRDDWVRAVGAGYAVVSVGRKSPFGHPHEEVVGRWRESGSQVLMTGESGTVTVTTDGSSLSIKTFRATLK